MTMEVSKKGTSYHEDTELRLGLPGTDNQPKKRLFSDHNNKLEPTSDAQECCDGFAPPKKVQAIGWPPIRSFRKNCLRATKVQHVEATSIYVKVGMDGAPYLRKIDLRLYRGYKDLLKALEDLFQLKADVLFQILENCKYNGSGYKPTYEDKDGDWMLVGDVPWEMFINSCRRLRIMKGPEVN